ncbi:MAG: hypothetical protein LHW51_00115 [Candidatus Cloacimonetes bacterium]|nr:hypothetical protein [Candidatus Cloacimonadota bacterium]MCB5260898.1 hypothetical protein [Candidatus Cloacimonadota bacterium]
MKFYPTSSNYTLNDWESLCPENQYLIFDPSLLTCLIPASLLAKVSKCLVAHTSSFDGKKVFVVQMYRHDKGNTVFDEHHYVSLYDTISNLHFEGYIEHANYSKRTFNVSFVSGSFAVGSASINQIFPFNAPPQSGSLEELSKLGLRDGVEYSYNFAYSKAIAKNTIVIS